MITTYRAAEDLKALSPLWINNKDVYQASEQWHRPANANFYLLADCKQGDFLYVVEGEVTLLKPGGLDD